MMLLMRVCSLQVETLSPPFWLLRTPTQIAAADEGARSLTMTVVLSPSSTLRKLTLLLQ